MAESFERRAGTVSAFDETRGLGEVTTESGERLGFHCTAIADGSRTIAINRPVQFLVVPGQLGRWEAVDIRDRD